MIKLIIKKWLTCSNKFRNSHKFQKNENFLHFLVKNYFSFFLNSVSENEKNATFTFFIDALIFSDHCSKNHGIFIFHLLLTFLEILWKIFANQVQIFYWSFFEFPIKNQAESLVKFSGIYLVSVCQPMEVSSNYLHTIFKNFISPKYSF